jgi:hypothetical protein
MSLQLAFAPSHLAAVPLSFVLCKGGALYPAGVTEDLDSRAHSRSLSLSPSAVADDESVQLWLRELACRLKVSLRVFLLAQEMAGSR